MQCRAIIAWRFGRVGWVAKAQRREENLLGNEEEEEKGATFALSGLWGELRNGG